MLRACAIALGFAGIASCAPGEAPRSDSPPAQPAHTAPDILRVPGAGRAGVQPLDWSDGPEGLSMRRPGPHQVAEGPSAIALAPSGDVLVLDRLAGRVARLDREGRLSTVAMVPEDAVDLASAADGSFVAFSRWRATAWIHDASGDRAGEMRVPRELHELLHVELGPSRQVTVRTGYQELLQVGSPAAPLPLAVTLRTKKEGAALLADGRGVLARVRDGEAELWIVEQAHGEERSRIAERWPIDQGVDAARLVGVEGTTACVRLERVSSSPTVRVDRSVRCLDVTTGAIGFEQALPAPGLYVPHRELAMGGGELALFHPKEDGPSVHRWRIGAEVRP